MKLKTKEELEELDLRERAVSELEARAAVLDREVEAKAAAIVKMKEKEFEDKKKAHVRQSLYALRKGKARDRGSDRSRRRSQEAEQDELAQQRRCVGFTHTSWARH